MRLVRKDVGAFTELLLKGESRFMGFHGMPEANLLQMLSVNWHGHLRLLPGPTADGWGNIISCAGIALDAGENWWTPKSVQMSIDTLTKLSTSSKHASGFIAGFITKGTVKRCQRNSDWQAVWGQECGHLVHFQDHTRSWAVFAEQCAVTFLYVDCCWLG